MNHQLTDNRYQPIENYGIIGNLHTVALVCLNGSIDYMCFMRFDSPTVFCRMLDADKGGHFSITPVMENMISKQLYLPNTNVLVTRFFSDKGIAEIIDYMPVSEDEFNCAVIRKVKTVRGQINYKLKCAPRFNYASTSHTIEKEIDNYVFVPDDHKQTSLRLLSEVAVEVDDQDITAQFSLNEGETTCFILEAAHNLQNRQSNINDYIDDTYQSTIHYWQQWIAQSTYSGPWSEVVNRSALTLKLLISHKYGSMVAAPTFSLPEAIGESRNWDYRYTWIRDAAFSMHAFLQLGFLTEAKLFLEWVKKQSTEKELQLMFAIDGRTDLKEYTLDYLEGYKNSKPVRVGNDAHKQTQMDIYGELMETLYIYSLHGGDLTYDFWKIVIEYIDYVMDNWKKPDHSIWEVRGKKREFLFSRMMCWVAMDRAIKIGTHFSFPFDMQKWHTVRNEIYIDVYENFWNPEKEAFVQYKGADTLDASTMLMPILNMISTESEKWIKTMKAIDRELRSDVLVYRYRENTDEIDGLKGKEGTFTMCSFWYVECLALAGRTEEANEHFEKMLGYANHLGLFAEQLSMKGEHLGNFPQAFTHLALISAAMELHKKKKKPFDGLPHNNKGMK